MVMNNSVNSIDLRGRMFSCPVQGKTSTFQVVDEFGAGKPYAGLAFKVVDFEGVEYKGYLDMAGVGKVENHFAGPIALIMN